ncbi:slipin family protein [Parabacteroides sp. OttesenSCG-928-G07]|nr:slipin family protein [Parabacteroides sp. OttesenSCG-928-G07]
MAANVMNKGWFNPISFSVLLILIIVSIALCVLEIVNIPVLVILLILSALLAFSIRIADQWERAVVLRMGKYKGLRGPGPFVIIPILDSVSTYIDQRVRVSAFKAEQTLTKDTVPVNVDAVVYWTVWDVEKAALEVQEYQKAIEHIAQTGLRDTIGKHELSALLQERDKIAEDLQQVLDRNTNPWGITCQTVGINDIAIPKDLADAMSKEAQAERERRARVILGTAETEIAEKFEQASRKYTDNPVALHLRGMNMLFEGLKEKGSMVIVPSSALDSMNLGAIGGLVSLAKSNETSAGNKHEEL